MLEFNIPNMSCGHCVRAITEAVLAVDPKAQVQIDLSSHHVKVDSLASREALVAQLTEAGYTPAT